MNSIYSELALEEAEPERQMEALGALLIEDDPLRGISIPNVPAFKAQTPSEFLLLTYLFPDTEESQGTERTLRWTWDALEATRTMRIDAEKIADVSGHDVTPGFKWVGFDPLGVTLYEQEDFRADIFIRMPVGHTPLLNFGGGQRNAWEVAGIEAFIALLLVPGLVKYPWEIYDVILPRLDAHSTHGNASSGPLLFNGRKSSVHVEVNAWEHNYYGHLRAIPTLRELP